MGMTDNGLFDDAVLLHQRGRLQDAEQFYRGILQGEFNHPGALHLLGVIRHLQGDHEAAIELIGRAISVNPRNAVYRNNYGLPLHGMGRFAEALDSFRRALEIRPSYAQALANLGMVQQSLGDHDAALTSYHDALRLEPYHPDAVIKLAVLLEKLGRAEESIGLYEDGIRHTRCLEFYVNLGALRIATNRADLAVGALQKATRLAPDCVAAHLNLGMAYSALGNDAQALASHRKALELQPGNPETLKRLTALLQKLGQGEEVIPLYEQALAQRPSAELRAQFAALTVLARRWDGPCATAAADCLLFDGMHYYTHDAEGNRTSRYRKDAHGNPINVTTYQWNKDNRLGARIR